MRLTRARLRNAASRVRHVLHRAEDEIVFHARGVCRTSEVHVCRDRVDPHDYIEVEYDPRGQQWAQTDS